jgi:glycosyltransferase involved in cell wall biosynthesis
LSFIHKIARKFIYKGAHVFLPVSIKGANQIRTYHVDPKKIFICPYTVNNEKFLLSGVEKKYDLMFSGQFIPRKMPSFFLEIVEKLSHKNPNLSILLLGDGPLKEFIINKLTQLNVKFYYPGFVQPEDLPVFYSQTRIFLFPTEEDAWGVVANEACAAGVPVMTCENAGAANELIIDNYNGYVLPLNSDIWVDKILKVLGDIELQKILSTNCLLQIKKYTKEFSAQSFIKACNSI